MLEVVDLTDIAQFDHLLPPSWHQLVKMATDSLIPNWILNCTTLDPDPIFSQPPETLYLSDVSPTIAGDSRANDA